MAEFMPENAEDWNEEELAKFFDIDFNEDGVITASESLRSVEEGPASSLRARASGQTASAIAQAATTAASAKTPIDQKYVDLAKRIIGRRDKNGDGVLTGSEWKTMLMSPAAADANRDGKITADEYARWTKSRESAR
jgi:Ca2+-binding EF-hand superfamily protein